MRKLRRKSMGWILSLFLVCMCTMPVYAANSDETPTYASYDMTVGGTQTFRVIDANGEESTITVRELEQKSRVADGAYQVEYSKFGLWKAGYKISVVENRILSVYGKYKEPIIGTITNDVLTLDNSKQATYRFSHSWGILVSTTGVRSLIDGNNLNVYPL